MSLLSVLTHDMVLSAVLDSVFSLYIFSQPPTVGGFTDLSKLGTLGLQLKAPQGCAGSCSSYRSRVAVGGEPRGRVHGWTVFPTRFSLADILVLVGGAILPAPAV